MIYLGRSINEQKEYVFAFDTLWLVDAWVYDYTAPYDPLLWAYRTKRRFYLRKYRIDRNGGKFKGALAFDQAFTDFHPALPCDRLSPRDDFAEYKISKQPFYGDAVYYADVDEFPAAHYRMAEYFRAQGRFKYFP